MELNEKTISEMDRLDEKIITKYQKKISKEIKNRADIIGINKARQEANLKYGRGWREKLEIKKIFNNKSIKNYEYEEQTNYF